MLVKELYFIKQPTLTGSFLFLNFTVFEKFKNIMILFLSSSRIYFFYSHTARFYGNTKILNQNLEKHQK